MHYGFGCQYALFCQCGPKRLQSLQAKLVSGYLGEAAAVVAPEAVGCHCGEQQLLMFLDGAKHPVETGFLGVELGLFVLDALLQRQQLVFKFQVICLSPGELLLQFLMVTAYLLQALTTQVLLPLGGRLFLATATANLFQHLLQTLGLAGEGQ